MSKIDWSTFLSHAGSDLTMALTILAAVPSSPVAESLPPTWKAPIMTAGVVSALVLRGVGTTVATPAPGAPAKAPISTAGLGLLIATLLCLCGCGTSQGLRLYTKLKSEDPKTHVVTERMGLLAACNADMPGVSGLETKPDGGVKISFDSINVVNETPQYDAKGNLVATEKKALVNGIYTTSVITAAGDADTKRINAGAAGATGLGLSWFGPGALGKGLGTAASTLAH